MINNAPSRRSVLSGAVAGGLALPVLAACGSSGSADDVTAEPATGGSGGSDASGSKALASTSEIPVGGGKVFDAEKVVVTQPAKGEFKAFSAVCTHQGCLVTTVSDGEIHCPCHGSTFSATDGSVKVGPAARPLPKESITVKGGEITLA